VQYINIKKILKKNLFFSDKKIDLYQAFDIFLEKKFKIISFIFFFVIIFFLLGLKLSTKYYYTVNIISNYNQKSISNEKYNENENDLITNLLKETLKNDSHYLEKSNFFSILEKNFLNKKLLTKFLNTNTKVDYLENFYVKRLNNKFELFYEFNKEINNKFLYEYVEYIFDLSFLEFKDITLKSLKIEISGLNDFEIICGNLTNTVLLSESICSIKKEKVYYYQRYLKKLEKMESFKDYDNNSIYFTIDGTSPELRSKITYFYIIYGLFVGLFLSFFLFFNKKNKV
jgi:hypothetical protein